MIFLPLLILSFVLYIIGKRVSSILIFFFFLFDGFQMFPEILFETHIGISKSIDFAFIYVLILFIYGMIRYDDFIPINKITKLIALYLSFIIICIGISLLYYQISFIDIIRTSRAYFLVLAYFIIRRLETEEIEKLLKILFIIVLFQSILFIIQAFTGIALLAGATSGRSGIITRFYNSPLMLYFFVFYAIFYNPFQDGLKTFTIIISSITMFLPLHRSLQIVFILCAIIGIYIKMGGIRKLLKYIPFCLLVFIPIMLLVAKNLGGRTVTDINSVLNGEFIDVSDDFVMDEDGTFMFRMAHFFERFVDVTSTPVKAVFGAGFMTEDSDYTYNRFDYIIGLPDEKTENIIQLDTSDISWSNFIIRYGVLGTCIYLYMFFSFLAIFKRDKKTIGLPIYLYLILLFLVSFTNDLMYQNRMLIFPLMLYSLLPEVKNEINKIEYEQITLYK